MSFDIFGACPDENEVDAASSTTVLTLQDLDKFNEKAVFQWLLGFRSWYVYNKYTARMQGWTDRILPIYKSRLKSTSRRVYRLTNVDKVLTLDKKILVWKKQGKKPFASFTTQSSQNDWYQMSKKLAVDGLVLSADANLNTIAFTSRIVWDFVLVCKQHSDENVKKAAGLMQKDLRSFWNEHEVSLFYPISSTVVAAVGRG